MSIKVLLREHPHRSIALVTPTYALIFRHSPSTNDAVTSGFLNTVQPGSARTPLEGQLPPKCMVEFAPSSALDLSDYRTLSPLPVFGTLGLITINNDVFLCVVTGAVKVATVRPGETVEKIFGVDFYSLNSSDYDESFSNTLDPYGVEDNFGQNISHRDPLEHPCIELQRLLSNGSFYYSTDFDLTNRLQDRQVMSRLPGATPDTLNRRSSEATAFDLDNLDHSFLWNSYMISPLAKFRSRLVAHEKQALDRSRILTSAIRGFVLSNTIPAAYAPLRHTRTGLPSNLTIISRLSSKKAGTRFNSRGIDDDGNVANFVETETIYWSPPVSGHSPGEIAPNEVSAGICFSYSQIRGSVPVFWEQAPGLLPGQQKISITRSAEGTQPAFNKHFAELEHNYGPVHIVNLLSETKPGEAELTGLYRYGVQHCALNRAYEKKSKEHEVLKETEFDFHAETRGNNYEAASSIRRLIEASADSFAYYLSEEIEDISGNEDKPLKRSVVVLQQEGVFRTNCLDCLDRTNLIQTIISQMALEAFLGHRGERATSDFWARHSSMWADNGDALSKIYAGTGALKSSFTRHGKMSLAGAIADARKSATRLYINNFADKGRQNTIDVLLGRLVGQTPVHLFDPINDYVTAELAKRASQFQSSQVINIWCGTFNLNGRITGIDKDLSAWLCPQIDKSQQQPQVVAVGFQEIVELSPQQIMNSDPTRKEAWEHAVRKCLNAHAKAAGSDNYVLLRSGQLVGAALCIFVKTSVLKSIKNVEGSVKKTGMSGMAGNKGAVAIRMDYANTQICFVTAHFAAGFPNYDERNRDYNTIHHGLRFQRNRGIDNHDYVIWMGDFNYRIGLGTEKVRQLIKAGDLETLYSNDQLNLQMVAGLAFPYYSESRITFMPTYKFDLGVDTYDSSEKARIPAWTDRILRKGTNLRQILYDIAPLRFSDHRPVYATFQCRVSIVDEDIKENLSRELYERRRMGVGSTTANTMIDETDDDDLIGYDPIEPGLPPASSDKRKWWLDNSQPARSRLEPPHKGDVPNPNRPSNPFSYTDEPDWVTVPRMSGQSSASLVNTSFAPPPRTNRQITASNSVRKLPPPYDTTQLMKTRSQASLKDTKASKPILHPPNLLDQSPPQRQTSISTTNSSTTSSKRPSPPPVGRKPPHLASSARLTPTIKPPTLSAIQTQFDPPPRSSNFIKSSAMEDYVDVRRERDMLTSTPPPPPQPRTAGRGKGGAAAGDGEIPPPGLQPRRVQTDLLGDDEMQMSGWEALEPVR